MLPARVQNVLKSCLNDIEEQLYLVGVSGGADSISLLDILSKLEYSFIVAHFNHQIRPTSLSDNVFVQDIAAKYGLECVVGTANVPGIAEIKKTGIEETARVERYNFLFESAEKLNCSAVLVAHTADDQVETVLMHLIRGSGSRGITGMSHVSKTGYSERIPLIRPLLSTWRCEVEQYCRENDLHYVQDESNKDAAYLRNRIRLELIPQLQDFNPGIKESIFRLSENISLETDFMEIKLNELIPELGIVHKNESTIFRLQEFLKQEILIQQLIIKKFLEEKFGNEFEPSKKRLQIIQEFFCAQTASTSMPIGKCLMLIRDSERGILTKNPEYLVHKLWPNVNEKISIYQADRRIDLSKHWEIILSIEGNHRDMAEKTSNSKNIALLDYQLIKYPLVVRNIKLGDRFSPFGMPGMHMKLSDYFINQKIPRIARQSWPLIDSAGDIIWIPGLQIADNPKVTGKTKEVLRLELKEKD